MKGRAALIIAGFAVVVALGGAGFAFRGVLRDAAFAASKPKLPPAVPYVAANPKPQGAKPQEKPRVPSPTPAAVAVPAPAAVQEMNLAVPFTAQAPRADWSMPYQEACEEASLIMADAYFRGESTLSVEEAEKRILDLVEWQMKRFGYFEDTDAAEVVLMAKERYGLQAEVKPISSMADAKKELAAGRVVILPASGRDLGNPYFRPPGPLYHMLVVKGFTKDGRVITNDPGTRRGADYLYDPAVLYAAVHDWNSQDMRQGAKVMVVVWK